MSGTAAHDGTWEARHERACAWRAAGRYGEALVLFSQLAQERPDAPGIHRDLVVTFEASGAPSESGSAHIDAVASQVDAAMDHFAAAQMRHAAGDLAAAEAGYCAALAVQPDMAGALRHLAVLLVDTHRYADAIEACRRLLPLDPDKAGVYRILGKALGYLGEIDRAAECYRRCIRLKPDMAAAHYNLAILLDKQGHHDQAAACLRHAIALEPVATVPAGYDRADFSVLMLWGPGVANTPMHYLLDRPRFTCHAAPLLLGVAADVGALRAKGDVVFSLLSDVDQAGDLLPAAAAFVAELGLPVMNAPARVARTGRESIPALIADIADIRVPRTARLSGAALAAPDCDALADFSLPLLVRPIGTHGGKEFERVEDRAAAGRLVADRPDAEFYVSEYADYLSADGFFRKYRFIYVDGRTLPYHLAIGTEWKLHHFRTSMADHAWMQDEERAFLEDPASAFTARHRAALEAIRVAVGLDYFGIDCAIDREGRLVVFEINASMLVHADATQYPYKAPFAARIKDAFEAMLAKAAARAKA